MTETFTHAGGVVVRDHDGARRALLVRAKPAPHDWVLPKGHIEPGETPEVAARREVQEEAGVDAEVLRYIGRLDYVGLRGPVHAAFYVMRFVRTVTPTERREMQWCSLDQALALVQFDDVRRLIEQAFNA